MAVEKLLAIQFIKENMLVLKEHQTQSIRGSIPHLELPEYVIGKSLLIKEMSYFETYHINFISDFEYVILETRVCRSVPVVNYGLISCELQARVAYKNLMSKFGIYVQFKKGTLGVKKETNLNITFCPSRSMYRKRINNMKQTIYLKVKLLSSLLQILT